MYAYKNRMPADDLLIMQQRYYCKKLKLSGCVCVFCSFVWKHRLSAIPALQAVDMQFKLTEH